MFNSGGLRTINFHASTYHHFPREVFLGHPHKNYNIILPNIPYPLSIQLSNTSYNSITIYLPPLYYMRVLRAEILSLCSLLRHQHLEQSLEPTVGSISICRMNECTRVVLRSWEKECRKRNKLREENVEFSLRISGPLQRRLCRKHKAPPSLRVLDMTDAPVPSHEEERSWGPKNRRAWSMATLTLTRYWAQSPASCSQLPGL